MSFGVATLRALVHAGDKTSGDARCVINKGKCEVLRIKDEYIWEFIEGQLFDFFQGREIVNFVNKLLQTMYGMILYLVQCESLCRIPFVFPPLTRHFSSTDLGSDLRMLPLDAEESQPLARIVEAAALSPSSFHKMYRSSYETSSSSSPTLPVRKRYREDEGPGMEEEEATPEGQQQAVSVVDTTVSEPLGLGYGAARRRALESIKEIAPSTYEVGRALDPEDDKVYTDIPAYAPPAAPVKTPLSPEWSLGSLPVSPSSLVVSHRP
ncbi:hypothetical protein Tco_0838138 [Tanacetum coccineum]|uniref:Uncharacterized protein n=1 Tax=Tanacetum coccineum TaxID=301880 RepID=A0ABQ5AQT8_9ASTR